MFARVVWLRFRRAQNRRFSLYPVPHALATHYFLRLTRARGKRYQREGNALFDDFWYFWSRKSTIKEKLLHVSYGGSKPYPVSATPTHMLRICVNPSFEHLLSPRGDRCEHTSPTVRQLLNHGYRFETLKRRLGFAAVPCRAMANLAVEVWVRVCVRT